MVEQTIKCPKCGEPISIDKVLEHQIEEKIKKDFAVEQKNKEDELDNEKKKVQLKEQQLAEAIKSAEIEVNKKVAEKLATEKVVLWKNAQIEADKQKSAEIKILDEQIKEKDKKLTEANAEALKAHSGRQKLEDDKKNFELEKVKQIEAERKKIEEDAFTRATKQNERDSSKLREQLKEAEKEKEAEKKMLEEQLKEKDEKLSEANKNEIEIRKEKNKLEEDKKNFELEKQRQMDEERKKIAEEAGKKATEEQQYVIAQLKKQLSDAIVSKDDLARKLEQGSQQLQGEVLEIDIEDFLKQSFVFDEIEPVAKGERGADILQKVYTKKETFCGSILYELKRQKNWSEPWITKLKDDQIKAKADIAVIVSDVLPKDIVNFAFRKNVYICNRLTLPSLAPMLRSTLAQVALAKLANESKDEKVELLYRYLSGSEFTQKLGSAVETFVSMKVDLEKEKRSTIARWAKQEKQIDRVVAITAGRYGDL
ncbi:MAG: DUF2130 domain-containing protein, partial [Candidatus Staskawiczbacteria bacterium]|nr:DUF2130 domain-containing protein [Candidatus Staskawiczbacteria bacterium]